MLFEVELMICWIYYSCSFLAIAKMISIIIMVINLLNMFGIINFLVTGYSGNSKFIVPLETDYWPRLRFGQYSVSLGAINLLLPSYPVNMYLILFFFYQSSDSFPLSTVWCIFMILSRHTCICCCVDFFLPLVDPLIWKIQILFYSILYQAAYHQKQR